MRRTLILPALATLLGFVACGEKKPKPLPVTTTQTKGAPAWIDQEEIPDGLAAVGIASMNPMGDKGVQRYEAIAQARANLAAKLKIRVQNVFLQLDQRMKSAAANDKGPVKSDVMLRVQENVARQLVDQTLMGSAPKAFWTDPADGNLYVFVVMDKETLDRSISASSQEQIRREIANGEKALESALDKLDAAIAASGS